MVEFTQKDIENIIINDRMKSFMVAAINWGSVTGMSPQILEAGKMILMGLQAPAEAPSAKKEEEPNPDNN